MKVDDIPAGRELDALVAERVMGWLNCDLSGRGIAPKPGPVVSGWHQVKRIPDYSTDIAAAWEVVKKMMEMLDDVPYHFASKIEWSCGIKSYWDDDFSTFYILKNLTPAFICHAALKAVGVKGTSDED